MTRKLTKDEMKLWKKFKKPGCGNLNSCKINQPKISAANTWEHESHKLKRAHECLKKNHLFIMEACEIKTGRIRDFVCLTECLIEEYERSKEATKKKESEGAYNSPNCDVVVKKLWKSGDQYV